MNTARLTRHTIEDAAQSASLNVKIFLQAAVFAGRFTPDRQRSCFAVISPHAVAVDHKLPADAQILCRLEKGGHYGGSR